MLCSQPLSPADADAGTSAPAEASALPVSDKPVTLSFKSSLATNKVNPATTGLILVFISGIIINKYSYCRRAGSETEDGSSFDSRFFDERR